MTSPPGPLLFPVLALAASLSGALLVAALVGGRHRAGGRGARGVPAAAIRLAAWWIVAAIAASAVWLSALAVTIAFAAISALALSAYFARLPRRAGGRALRAACYACIPVQYAFVATAATGPFVVGLPLVVTLALPLLAVAARDTRDLADRVAESGWGVLLCVYCVSHVAAVLMLDVPGFAGRAGLLAAFVVIVASAGELPRSARAAIRASDAFACAALAAATGAALHWLTPFSPLPAGAAALLLATLALAGRRVLAAVAPARDGDDAAVDARAILGRPAGIAFAAPVWFHVLHALYGP